MNEIVCWEQTMQFNPVPVMHTHPWAEFYICTHQPGTQVIPSGHVPMKPGDFFYFPANQQHIGNGPPPVHGSRAGRSGKAIVIYVPATAFLPGSEGDADGVQILRLLDAWMPHTRNQIVLSKPAMRRIMTIGREMVAEAQQGRIGYRGAVKAALQQMLLTIARDQRTPAELVQRMMTAHRESRMKKVCQHMQTYYMNPIRIEQLARMAFLSVSQFHAVFSREIGCTAVEYLTRIRMQHAGKRLLTTGDSMSQIAAKCGFPCQSHFYRVFRSRYGCTPRQVRTRGRI